MKNWKKTILSGRFWKIVILCAAIAFFLYCEYIVVYITRSEWGRIPVEDGGKSLSRVATFWSGICTAVPVTQLLAVCIAACVRQLRKPPIRHPYLPTKKWKRLFLCALLLLGIVMMANHYISPLFYADYDAIAYDFGVMVYGIHYSLIIAAELLSGLLIWLLWDRLQYWVQKKLQMHRLPNTATGGKREDA